MKPQVFVTLLFIFFLSVDSFAQGSMFTMQGSPSHVRPKGKKRPGSRRAMIGYTAEWKPGSHNKKFSKINTRTAHSNEPYWDKLEAAAGRPGKENSPGTIVKPSRKRKNIIGERR